MSMQVYLDNSATTRPCAQAVEAVAQSMTEAFHNPSALYAPAMRAEHALADARHAIAATLHAQEKNVIFTSGGTESDNLAIWGRLSAMHHPGEVLYTAAEHEAVKNACLEAQARYGVAAREIPLLPSGTVDLTALEGMLGPQTALICVMQVCNETGVIMPVKAICELRDRLAPQAAIHVDGVQGYLRVPFSFKETKVDSYALSAHKIHGPKGVGALVLADGARIKPIVAGGGQQGGLRSGTENTSGIAGMVAAVQSYPVRCHGAHAQPQKAAFVAFDAGTAGNDGGGTSRGRSHERVPYPQRGVPSCSGGNAPARAGGGRHLRGDRLGLLVQERAPLAGTHGHAPAAAGDGQRHPHQPVPLQYRGGNALHR